MDEAEVHALKAKECLAGARSELADGRFNNAANRAYYAAYHAAVVALMRAGVERSVWYHDDVMSLFAGTLVRRRKLFPAALRGSLYELAEVRTSADYEPRLVSRRSATSATELARRFVQSVMGGTP